MNKSLSISVLTLLSVILHSLYIDAQTFEEFARQREADFQEFLKERIAFNRSMEQQYTDYVAKRDHEFTAYLNQRWEEYSVFAGMIREDKPKPEIIPGFDSSAPATPSRSLPVIVPEPVISVTHIPEPDLPIIQSPDDEWFTTQSLRFEFYGTIVALTYDPEMRVQPSDDINNEEFSQFWNKVSKSSYNYLINQLTEYSRKMNLNDWGYYLLVKRFSNELYDGNENGVALMSWFLMNRSGYRAKAAYYENQALLMLPSVQAIYQVPYQVFDGIRFYMVQGRASSIFTYEDDFPDAMRIMDMTIGSPPNLGNEAATRDLSFEYDGVMHNLGLKYCSNTISFYKDYPQVEIPVYFDSTVSPTAQESLAESLMPFITGMNDIDAANFFLNFTQTAFNYKTDQEQFGREKFFFVEEVLHYPYSDCEDRSVLFAYLVRELLQLKVIGLEYDDHIATAVHFSVDPGGDHVLYNNRKYTVCDPTYINAPVGMTMPKYANVAADIIVFDNSPYYGNIARQIWEDIYAAGGYRGGNRRDIVFDDIGNAYATGFFKGNAQFGNIYLSSSNDSYGAFLAKFGNDRTLKWVRQPDSQYNAIAYHIALDNDRNVYFSGTYNDQVTFENTTLKATGQADVFIAKYSQSGNLIWAANAGVDTLNPATKYMFVASFDEEGRHLGLDLYMENIIYDGYGICFDSDGLVYLSGSSFANTGLHLASMAYETAATFDPITGLKKENDRLLGQGYDRAIAGLFATINLIKLNNVVIPGQAAQQALDRYNPDFKRRAPVVYNAIGNINFLKNDHGVVLITTEGGGSITIDYLRIRNNSAIKIREFSNGNTQLDVLSGLQVGKAFFWYDLNFVQLKKYSGNLLFDYSRNNTQRTFNMEEDIFY